MTKKELITSLQKIIKPYVQDQEAFKNLSEETDYINDLKVVRVKSNIEIYIDQFGIIFNRYRFLYSLIVASYIFEND